MELYGKFLWESIVIFRQHIYVKLLKIVDMEEKTEFAVVQNGALWKADLELDLDLERIRLIALVYYNILIAIRLCIKFCFAGQMICEANIKVVVKVWNVCEKKVSLSSKQFDFHCVIC